MSTTTQGAIVNITARAQETAAKTFSDWTESIQDYSSGLIKAVPGLPSTRETVNNCFDFAERLLRTYREFVTGLLGAVTEAKETTLSATEKAAHNAAQAIEQASESTKTAAAKATHNTTRVSRNGAAAATVAT
jgi:hypothetical protein